ncbi:MRC1 protein, partial [Horornis vulcanius]|nr:MRC1 protein [Horornis vulcanius]
HNNFWKTNPVTETHYQINSESLLTWHQARKSCQQQDAELLRITDLREEIGFAAAKVLQIPSLEKVKYFTVFKRVLFLFFKGNPSVEPGKICGTFQGRNGKWENQLCDRKLGYICQKRNTSLDSSTIA